VTIPMQVPFLSRGVMVRSTAAKLGPARFCRTEAELFEAGAKA